MRLTLVCPATKPRFNLGLGRRCAPCRAHVGDRRNRRAPCKHWQGQVNRHARPNCAPHWPLARISAPSLGTFPGLAFCTSFHRGKREALDPGCHSCLRRLWVAARGPAGCRGPHYQGLPVWPRLPRLLDRGLGALGAGGARAPSTPNLASSCRRNSKLTVVGFASRRYHSGNAKSHRRVTRVDDRGRRRLC